MDGTEYSCNSSHEVGGMNGCLIPVHSFYWCVCLRSTNSAVKALKVDTSMMPRKCTSPSGVVLLVHHYREEWLNVADLNVRRKREGVV